MGKGAAESRAKDVLKPLEGPARFQAVVDLAARRGFFAPSAEIYGGLAGFYDYGPLGALMMRRITKAWVDYWTRKEGFFLVDTPTIGPEAVFRASGHLDKFADPLVECKKCHKVFRKDDEDRIIAKLRDQIGELPPGVTLKDEWFYHLTQEFLPKALQAPDDSLMSRVMAGMMTGVEKLSAPDQDDLRRSLNELRSNMKKAKGLARDPEFFCEPGVFHDFAEARPQNLMFRTDVGAGSGKVSYLRPETAQGIFWNFPWLLRHNRGRIPFGVAQLGLGYRNEIAPRNALFRLREFHMAEVEVFIDPSNRTWPRFPEVASIEATFQARDGAMHLATFGEMVKSGVIKNQVTGHFAACAYEIVRSLGMPDENMRLRQHMPDEMAHYAQDCWDLELLTSLGWIECAGIADRGVYDLTRHQAYSGADMSVFVPYEEPKLVEVDAFVPDFRALGPKYKGEAAAVGEAIKVAPQSALQPNGSLLVKAAGKDIVVDAGLFRREHRNEKKAGETFVPAVVEPAFGLDRIFFALMDAALTRVEKEGEPYTILRLDPRVAPVTVCVFPLMPKDKLDTVALRVHRELVGAGIASSYDDAGSIGKRYARADEAGVPWCITVDYDSLNDMAATLRHRDTQEQERLPMGGLLPRVQSLLQTQGGAA